MQYCWQVLTYIDTVQGCTVVYLVVLSAWSLHVLPMHTWVPTGHLGFLPQYKHMTLFKLIL